MRCKVPVPGQRLLVINLEHQNQRETEFPKSLFCAKFQNGFDHFLQKIEIMKLCNDQQKRQSSVDSLLFFTILKRSRTLCASQRSFALLHFATLRTFKILILIGRATIFHYFYQAFFDFLFVEGVCAFHTGPLVYEQV